MKAKDAILSIAEAIMWFAFLYYLLFSIKNDVNLVQSAIILLIIGYLGAWACPLIRNSEGWKKTWGKQV